MPTRPEPTSRAPATYVRALGHALPRFPASQHDVSAFMRNVAAHQPSASATDLAASRLARNIDRVYAGSGINCRYSVIRDFTVEPRNFEFFPANWRLDPFPTTRQRMELYRREAPALARSAVDSCLSSAPEVTSDTITHLIVASCTGFFAPGIDVQLAAELRLNRDVERTMIGFMGCYAAFNALRAADAICRSTTDAVVLVVCVELCSIHFQRAMTMSNVVGNCLFGDGAATALLTSQPPEHTRGRFRILAAYTELHPDAGGLLTWDIGDTGFEMVLEAEVPAAIEAGVAAFTDRLCARGGIKRSEVACWAIHPGGRRILDVIAARLELDADAMAPSYRVLSEVGNLSSPTILFTLARALATAVRGDRCVAMGFGPGLTFTGMLFEML